MSQHILYYEITAYICDPQPGELQLGYTHTSGPIYIVENGVDREVEVGDCFWSPARSAYTPQNPTGNVLGYNVLWKTVSRQWNAIYNSSNAGPRQHGECCDYWVCPNPGSISPNPCTQIMGNPPVGISAWFAFEVDCISQCAGDPGGHPPYSPAKHHIGALDPVVDPVVSYPWTPPKTTHLPVVVAAEYDCLDIITCPCGFIFHEAGTGPVLGPGWPGGYCLTPDWNDPNVNFPFAGSQIVGAGHTPCVTVVNPANPGFTSQPQLGQALFHDAALTLGVGMSGNVGLPPGTYASNGAIGAANGGYITFNTSDVRALRAPIPPSASHYPIWTFYEGVCDTQFPFSPYAPTPQNKKIINLFNINANPIKASKTKRVFTVLGDVGAIFSLTVKNNAGRYYNFVDNAFQVAAVKLAQQEIDFTGKFSGNIDFPTVASDDTYDIELYSESGHNTFLDKNAISNSAANSKTSSELVLKKSISQYSETTITFSLRSPSNSSYYNTLPSAVTSAISPSISDVESNEDVEIDWDVTLSSRNFSLARQPVITDFETDRSDIYTTNGTGSSATALILDDVSRLETDMTLTAIESGSVSGSPVINSIAVDTKTVTLSVAQSWADGKEITFTSTGDTGSVGFFDSSFSITNPKVVIADITTTTNGAVSASATVTVASPNGLKASLTQTVDGATKEAITVTLDSVVGLWIGQYLVNISSGMENSAIKITGIDTSTKIVTFDKALTFADGVTLTFANTTVEGVGIIRDSDYPNIPIYISNIVGDDLTVNVAQTLENGITLTFKGNSRSATITGTMNTGRIGTTDFTTYLNLDNILYVTA